MGNLWHLGTFPFLFENLQTLRKQCLFFNGENILVQGNNICPLNSWTKGTGKFQRENLAYAAENAVSGQEVKPSLNRQSEA